MCDGKIYYPPHFKGDKDQDLPRKEITEVKPAKDVKGGKVYYPPKAEND